MVGIAGAPPAIFRIKTQDAVDLMMKTYDIDKNGTLDVEEAGTVPILSEKNFPRADRTPDGKLTVREFEQYVDSMKLEVAMPPSSVSPAIIMTGYAVDMATFDQIHYQARHNDGRSNFMNYMNNLTDKYNGLMQDLRLGELTEETGVRSIDMQI